MKWFAICVGLISLGGLIEAGGYMIGVVPDVLPQSHEVSPDGRNRITIVEEVHGTFGPILYVVRIGPDNDFLNWAFRKKLIEMDGEDARTTAPTATWIDANSVMVQLPVKVDKLAVAIRDGLYPHPAADRYGSVRIIYRVQ